MSSRDVFQSLGDKVSAGLPKERVDILRQQLEQMVDSELKGRPTDVLRVLRQAAHSLRHTPGELTIAHDLLCRAAFQSQFFAAALPVLDQPAVVVEPACGTSLAMYTNYFYYAGLLLAMYGRFAEACEMLETAVDVPGERGGTCALAQAVLMLLGPIVFHRPADVPKCYNNNSFEAFAAFSEAFLSSRADLQAVLQTYGATYAKVGLLEVATRAADEWANCALLRLTRVFTSLPLAEISRRIGEPEAVALRRVRQLVAGGRMAAEVGSDGLVRFVERLTTSKAALERALSETVTLADRLAEVTLQTESLSEFQRTTPEFSHKVHSDRRAHY